MLLTTLVRLRPSFTSVAAVPAWTPRLVNATTKIRASVFWSNASYVWLDLAA
jgi:hypothetical protein